jgi:ASPIC and UnbV/FG-GAP-like repeat
MLKRVIFWTIPFVLILVSLYTMRTDIAPYAQRVFAMQWRHFEPDPLPVEVITQLYDMGVTDADNDGQLDLYTANHNYRQFLFLNMGGGRYRDVLGEWGLDQSTSLPGVEQSRTPPAIDRPGLHVYWIGDALHLQFHAIEGLAPASATLRLFNLATIVKNDGVDIKENVSRLGMIPETRLEIRATRSSHLVLYLLTRGSPVNFRIDAPWARTSTFVGRDGITPKPYSGVADADAARAGDRCPTCLEFEMTLLDRHGMAWSDFNGDGVPDIFINRGALGGTLRTFPKPVRERVRDELLLSKGPGRFVDRASEFGIEKKDCSGRHVRWVDFDADGRLDLFINCLDRGSVAGGYPKQLYRQSPDKRFVDVAEQVKLDLRDHELVDMVWFDADGDGRIDLFTHEDSGYFLYRLVEGAYVRQQVHVGPFHRTSVAGLRGNTSDYWQFDGKLSTADLNADGRLDIFVASKRGNVLLINQSGGTFKPVSPVSIGLPAQSVAASWVDYDNDGHMDLHVVPEGLFRQIPGGQFVRTGLLALPEAKYQAAIINWYDRDNDGALDVVIALQENAALWRWWDKLHKSDDVKGKDDRFDWKILAYRNLAKNSNWLQLHLVGAAGNPEGIGARVTLATPSGQQARQVGSHEGSYLSHGHYRLYFGLGDQQGPVSLEVRWPDGTLQTLKAVSVNQRLTIQHPG